MPDSSSAPRTGAGSGSARSNPLPLPPSIAADEYRDRQQRARRALDEAGLAGLIAFGRGGGTQDRYAHPLYLAGAYSHFPNIEDFGAESRARGHAAVLIAVNGPTVAVLDQPAIREELVTCDDLVLASDVIGATAAVAQRICPHDSIGLAGDDVLAHRWHAALPASLRDRLVLADDLATELRYVKSPAEQALLRAAGQLGARAIAAVIDAAVPGATEAEAAASGMATVVAGGGTVIGMGIGAGATNAAIYAQNRPAPYDARRRLEHGDLFRIDLYGALDGYLFDAGRTVLVGGDGREDVRALIACVEAATLAGLDAVRPGARIADVARACACVYAEQDVVRQGLVAPTGNDTWGHSLGLAFEAPWIAERCERLLVPGVCLAIEKRIPVPGVGGANFEQNVLVTATGHDLLSGDWATIAR